MVRVAYLTNAEAESGVGHQAQAVAQRLQGKVELLRLHIDGLRGELTKDGQVIRRIAPWPKKSLNWVRLGRHLPRDEGVDIVHATNQTLSFALPRNLPTVVTVHDLIELLEPQAWGSGLLARYLYSGIRRASHIITVSEYTKRSVHDRFSIPKDRMTVIRNGVDGQFHLIDNFASTKECAVLRQELALPERAQVVLFVGSEHPRKNVTVALEAFARARRKVSDLFFVKVGTPGLAAGRQIMRDRIGRLRIGDQVRIVDTVTLGRLNELYNLAGVLIFPSRLEGFGLPPLQAMASGLPVVASRAASVPEVVGEAALLRDPSDVDGFADDLERILSDQNLRMSLREKGLARSRHFSWEKAAAETLAVYRQVSL